MTIHRIVPNIHSDHIGESKLFYTGFLGMEIVMDMGWIVTFASGENHSCQLSVLQYKGDETLSNDHVFISMEISDVNAMYEKARNKSYEITYALTNEPWGVRRFFVKDPNGATINLLSHL